MHTSSVPFKLLLLGAWLTVAMPCLAQTYQESGGIVIMEAENTPSSFGTGTDRWEVYGPGDPYYVTGATGGAHIEFQGNSPASGPPKTPLTYTFKINEGGLYRLEIRARKRLEGEPADRCNDCYVRMGGDAFGASPNAGDTHLDDATLAVLQRDTKIYGGNAADWGWAVQLDPGGHNNKRWPVYDFTAGSTYTLTVSGRSQRFNIDRIILRRTTVAAATARNPSLPESASGPTIPYSIGRIALSSDGNHHDPDDWGASIATLAIIASQGLQDKVALYTYCDHVWGNGGPNYNWLPEMHESVIVRGAKFGYDTSDTNIFIRAVDNPHLAYERMKEEILASTAANPLTIIAAGPMEVVGQGLKRAKAVNPEALRHVMVISHSNWNDVHSGIHHTVHGTRNDGTEDTGGFTTEGWTWYRTSIANPGTWYYQNPTGNYFTYNPTKDDPAQHPGAFPEVSFVHILDQNSANSVDVGFATHQVGSTNTAAENWTPWHWIRDYDRHSPEINEAIQSIYGSMEAYWPDISDCGMAYYLFTGNESGGPQDMKTMFDNGFDDPSAHLIGVDFNNVSPNEHTYSGAAVVGSAGDTWNNHVVLGGTNAAWTNGTGWNVTGANFLNDVAGNATTVQLNVKVGNPDTTNDGTGPSVGRFSGGAGDVDIASSIIDLKRDYMFLRHSGGTTHFGPDGYFEFNLTGLAEDTEYKLVIYAGGDGEGQGATFSNFSSAVDLEGGISAAYLPAAPATQKGTPVLGEDYIVADFTTGAGQTSLSFQAGNNAAANAVYTAVSGIQLQVIPEPQPPVDDPLVLDALTDFPDITAGAVPYYKDTARNALAINAANESYRDQFARATATFAGAAGTYDMTITALGETDGECTYRLLVNGVQVGQATNTRVTVDYGPQLHTFTGINVPAGATLAVESNAVSNGLIPEGDAFAYARGRWTTLTLAGATSSDGPAITSFVLVNATTNQDIGPITEGAVIDLASLETTELNVRAEASPAGDFGSVVFALSGATTHAQTENAPVWALFRDTAGDYLPGAFNPGSHTLTATPYPLDGGGGTAGTPLTVHFTVTAAPVVTVPDVDAGPDKVLIVPASQTTLSGLATDDTTLTATEWTQVSGPNTATLSGATTPALTASGLVEGLYLFRLTATNGAGNPASDDVRVFVVATAGGEAAITGDLMKWHKLTLAWNGPATSETATPNPFTDYRLNVVFTHQDTGKSYRVPGYFAADGNPADSGADSGNVWQAHFAPSETGTWAYHAEFRAGTNVAVNESDDAGVSAGFFDGDAGTFQVAASDKSGRDFRARGRLEYVGEHYPRFADSGEYFLKQGPDSPENFLAYEDFDATPNDGDPNPDRVNLRKSWAPHAGDYNATEASSYAWSGGRGTEMLGAINYLATKGMNAFSFLTFSVDGDDDNVFPHRLNGTIANYESMPEDGKWAGGALHKDRFDCSKLAQWGRVFDYATAKGMFLHFKTQETENDLLMDGGDLGPERKLYYRELIARFSHNLALNWNLGEENDIWQELNDPDQTRVKAYARYFHDHDPYRHPVVIHSYPSQKQQVYAPLLGSASKLTGASLQGSGNTFADTHGDVEEWLQRSAAAGKPWLVAVDEPGDAGAAIGPDAHQGNTQELGRRNALWATLMAGGWGNEWYFGYAGTTGVAIWQGDLHLQDYRSRDGWFDYCRHALNFFHDNSIPFTEMSGADQLVSGYTSNPATRPAFCFRKAGELYAVYLKNGGTASLDLSEAAGMLFDVKWYDPRNGGPLVQGSVTEVTGGGVRSLGQGPAPVDQDWVVLLQFTTPIPTAPGTVYQDDFAGTADIATTTVPEVSPAGFLQNAFQTGIDGSGRLQSTDPSQATAGYRVRLGETPLTDDPAITSITAKLTMRTPTNDWIMVGFQQADINGLLNESRNGGPIVQFNPTSVVLRGGTWGGGAVSASIAGVYSAGEVITAELVYHVESGTIDLSINESPVATGFALDHEFPVGTPSDPVVHWLQAQLRLQPSVADGGGYIDSMQVSIATAPPANSYAAWIAEHDVEPAKAGLADDADGDGLDNGVEAFFGTHPGVANAGLSQIALVDEATLSFTHPNPDEHLSDIAGTYLWSLDLVDWHESGDSVAGTTVHIVATPDDPVANTTTVRCSMSGTSPDKLFVTLLVEQVSAL